MHPQQRRRRRLAAARWGCYKPDGRSDDIKKRQQARVSASSGFSTPSVWAPHLPWACSGYRWPVSRDVRRRHEPRGQVMKTQILGGPTPESTPSRAWDLVDEPQARDRAGSADSSLLQVGGRGGLVGIKRGKGKWALRRCLRGTE